MDFLMSVACYVASGSGLGPIQDFKVAIDFSAGGKALG
jgi:hypothetical protein